MMHVYWVLLEEFEDTKGEVRICESKNRQDDTMAKGKGTIEQTVIYKTLHRKKDRARRIIKKRDELMTSDTYLDRDLVRQDDLICFYFVYHR